ncbi:MAG: CDP-alcohol phosphatidyltransferase family protein [Clostridia bacterium]|nr:CDP-alcohol phosphatidyltransferase family protein [Clostridia bacterium]
MIGIYDYTVVLTYLSLMSAGTGIVVSLSGGGHPYWGVFFLLLCGLFDAFDGRVARMKKNRTQMECNYGIQIDSLADVIAFGVLPATIGVALLRTSPMLSGKGIFIDDYFSVHWTAVLFKTVCYAILILYILAALIRLAYFNVTEEERQRTEGGKRKTYTGLPVTSASLIFPSVLLLRYILPIDISIVYVPVALITAFLFLSKIQVPKPGLRGILIMIGIGVLECVALGVFLYLKLNNLI